MLSEFASIILLSSVTTATATATELSSSAILFTDDIFKEGRCGQIVNRIADLGGSRVMFVPTLYWENNDTSSDWASHSYIKHICYESGNKEKGCPEVDAAKIKTFGDMMQRCFETAVSRGLDIAITPHLDDGLQMGRWRNGLRFAPKEVYGNHSYHEAILEPLVKGLVAAIKPSTKVWFGMMGEMSATVMYAPTEWKNEVGQLKKMFGDRDGIKVGISTNFDKLCHCLHVKEVDTGNYAANFKRDFHTVANQFNMPAIKTLFDTIDFFAISSYPSLTPDFKPAELDKAADEYSEEISLFGIDVHDLISKGKEFFYAEYGVGGGATQDGIIPAQNATVAAKNPFFTVFGKVNARNNPWANPSVAAYRDFFFNQTLKYLSTEPGKYKISGVFNWDLGTYDFNGIYDQDPLVMSPSLQKTITNHNQMVRRQANNSSLSSVERVPTTTSTAPVSAPTNRSSSGSRRRRS